MATVYECKGLNHTLQIYFLLSLFGKNLNLNTLAISSSFVSSFNLSTRELLEVYVNVTALKLQMRGAEIDPWTLNRGSSR